MGKCNNIWHNELRATCLDCKIPFCMYHSGEGEWICLAKKSKHCEEVICENRINAKNTESFYCDNNHEILNSKSLNIHSSIKGGLR